MKLKIAKGILILTALAIIGVLGYGLYLKPFTMLVVYGFLVFSILFVWAIKTWGEG